MKASPIVDTPVRSVLTRFAEAYAERDLAKLRALFVPDSDLVLYGTGADEKRLGVAEVEVQARRDWSQTEASAIAYEWTSVSAAGPVAWVASDAKFKLKAGGQDLSFPARLTMVLENRSDQWLIAQVHCSFPATDQSQGESFPTQSA
jgi:ketosteroid isomerase-like protein